jgi:predicted N-acetyltransferase YhbS
MEIRTVAGPSFEKLAKHLIETGQSVPNPILSVGFIAEDEEGNIVGHIIVHSVPIVEYLKVDEAYQGSGLGFELMEKAKEFIVESKCKYLLMHTGHKTMERILKKEYGCTELQEKYLEWRR